MAENVNVWAIIHTYLSSRSFFSKNPKTMPLQNQGSLPVPNLDFKILFCDKKELGLHRDMAGFGALTGKAQVSSGVLCIMGKLGNALELSVTKAGTRSATI